MQGTKNIKISTCPTYKGYGKNKNKKEPDVSKFPLILHA